MTVPSQPSTTPNPGDSTTPPATTPAPSTTPSQPVDLTKLSADDLKKVLENPEFFKLPRVAEAIEAEKELKKLREQQDKDANDLLVKEKKFEELSQKQSQEIETLKAKLQEQAKDSALTTSLAKESVVDLDGALKLVDKSKITINDDGTVEGVTEAVEALKAEKTYLFQPGTTPSVGAPSNPANTSPGTPGRYKFKESQLTAEFYQANKAEVDEAGRLGLIEPDGSPAAMAGSVQTT